MYESADCADSIRDLKLKSCTNYGTKKQTVSDFSVFLIEVLFFICIQSLKIALNIVLFREKSIRCSYLSCVFHQELGCLLCMGNFSGLMVSSNIFLFMYGKTHQKTTWLIVNLLLIACIVYPHHK